MNKLLLGLGVILLVVGGLFLVSGHGVPASATVVDKDMVIDGSYTTSGNMIFKNGAKLVVKGDLTVGNTLSCDGGPLSIEVGGKTTVEGTLACGVNNSGDGTTSGISMVVKGDVTFSKSAKVYSNGNVQIVNDAKKIRLGDAQVNPLYDDVGKNSGGPVRVGPFIEGSKVQVGGAKTSDAKSIPALLAYFVNVAYAQAQPTDKNGDTVPNVVIGGTWHIGDGSSPPSGLQIPKPPKGVDKIILNFDFGSGGNVSLTNFELYGPNGQDGDSDEGKNCTARGTDGKNAMRFFVNAGSIDIGQFTLGLGSGGGGGIAETTKDCDPGVASGGKGGEAGNFKMIAEKDITIQSFHIIPGAGGGGGSATAHGKNAADGCPGKKGGDATATGGDGGKNKKELAASGAVSGIDNVTIDPVIGGQGGYATANPGKGGNGNACKCGGGAGGRGVATAGKGGDASLSGISGQSTGGDGGDVNTHAGAGGTGGSCGIDEPTGGNGGKGGDASAKLGKGGNGGTSPGADGTVKDETGGNGGNGGDGCGPGGGGKGGKGKPPGTDGGPGKKICSEKKGSSTTIPSPSGSVTTPSGGTETGGGGTGGTGGGTTGTSGTSPGSTQTVQAIQYQGKYVPVSELTVMTHSGCSNQPHWHSKPEPGLPVRATDGSMVVDPGPECGFGTVASTPVMNVPATMDAQGH